MLDVYFTIDVELWCDGWHDIDAKFPGAFRRYIYGDPKGYGLPFQLRVLSDHGLKAVCFIEPLFAGRFGHQPLADIVGLVEGAGHESQLHLHTEWLDEAREPLLPGITEKRQFLRSFNAQQQCRLLEIGLEWLQRAGAPRPTAFRAGGFGFNRDTLTALAMVGIGIDSSYNATMGGPGTGVCGGDPLLQSRRIDEVLELPMTVYHDGRSLRHVQLTACSSGEMLSLLQQALEFGYTSFVILSHSAELLCDGSPEVDYTVVRRLRELSAFLERNSDSFRVRGLRGEPPPEPPVRVPPLVSPLWRTGLRVAEQALRHRHRWTR